MIGYYNDRVTEKKRPATTVSRFIMYGEARQQSACSFPVLLLYSASSGRLLISFRNWYRNAAGLSLPVVDYSAAICLKLIA
jgi:hypothetical protein